MAIAPEFINSITQSSNTLLEKQVVEVLQEGLSSEERSTMIWETLDTHFSNTLENKVVVFYPFTSFENPDNEDRLL